MNLGIVLPPASSSPRKSTRGAALGLNP